MTLIKVLKKDGIFCKKTKQKAVKNMGESCRPDKNGKKILINL